MTKVVRALSLDTRSTIEIDYTRPFKLVRLEFEGATVCMSSGPRVTLENRLLWSEQLDRTEWLGSSIGPRTRDGYVVPDGNLSLTKITANTSSTSNHSVRQVMTDLQDNETFSAAVYAKKAEYDYARLSVVDKSGGQSILVYQFSTRTVITATRATASPDAILEVEDLGDDLVRLIIRNLQASEGATAPYVRLMLQNNGSLTAWAGNNVEGTYYGGVQVWEGSDLNPYVASEGSHYGAEIYNEGQVAVGTFSWGPDGDQNGDIELFNENNAAVSLVLNQGVAEVPCTVFDCYWRRNHSPTVPVITASGVLTDSDITPSSALVSMTTVKAGVEFLPNRYVTPAEGFNWLPPDGAQVVWGNETYVIERE